MGQIIDGKALAAAVKEGLKNEIMLLMKKPKLVVILVGEDPASVIYVRNKEKDCLDVGISSEVVKLPENISQKELVEIIKGQNDDERTDGVLVQLPIPKGLNPEEALNAINPEKDVDGIHPLNMGRLLRGERALFTPCTPTGIMEMIKSTRISIVGKEAVVVGRSNIVGKPAAIMLLQEHATVTICHSRTGNLKEVCRRGDILIAAVGSPGIIQSDMVKPGAIVIDVGTNRIGTKLVGDVDYDSVKEIAAFISPVPGGVGLMTRAMLLKNTVLAAKRKS